MERFKLMTLVSTVIACAVSTSVMAKPAISQDVQAYIDQQIAQLNGPSRHLEAHDWNNLCSPGSIANGCMPDCSGSKRIACERVLSEAHSADIDGIPYPIVTGGMFVQSLTPTSTSSDYGPLLLLTGGSSDNFCTLHYVSGEFIPNRGTYTESLGTNVAPNVTQLRNTTPTTTPGRNYSHSSQDGTNHNFDLFQSGSVPVGPTFYMVCLGASYPAGSAITSGPVGNITVTW